MYYPSSNHGRRFLYRIVFALTAGLAALLVVFFTLPENASTIALAVTGALLLTATLLAGVAIAAYRREGSRLIGTPQPDAGGAAHDVTHLIAERRRRTPALEAGRRIVTVSAGQGKSPGLPIPVIPPGRTKVCPTCDREYQTAMKRCPFDRSLLTSKVEAQLGTQDILDTHRSVMRCRTCEREYDLGAQYCIHDGRELVQSGEEDPGAVYDGDMVCPECELKYDRESLYCPDDGQRLMPERSGRSHISFSPIPLKICPECIKEYTASETTCAACDGELLNLLGRTTGGLPPTGFGNKTKRCSECGLLHVESAQFCSSDGSKLEQLN